MTACVAGGEGAQRVSLSKMTKAVRCVRRRCMCCVASSVEVVVAAVATMTTRATSSAPVTASARGVRVEMRHAVVAASCREAVAAALKTKMMAAAATSASPCQA
ncbi:hypothetical protein PVAP13_1KG325010 [Panicum virgatum]|uniref:Uncharacterized protein n=1 Tax=Panicum virgatum TaxID=38727 RepID=A0A8T0XP65_PANVG|nr:hypothetical protein PVAP13_1KG325010 [Panicum virgatum]